MKSSKLVKIILIMIIGVCALVIAKDSYAAIDLTNSITGDSLTGNNTVANNTIENNTIANNTTKNTVNNVVLTTNNTSSYNNSSLPNTGIEDSIPSVILIVVLGISAVYAYKKMQDYKNI